MKKIILIAAVLFALQTQAQVTRAMLQASGLTCAMCSKAVFKALTAVPFVEKVQPNIQLSTYELSFKPGAKLDFDALSKAVVDAGFSVSNLKLTAKFRDLKVENETTVTLENQAYHFVNVAPQVLNGEKTIHFIDKNFVTARDHKKYGKATALKCFGTGTMDGKRIYHVTM